jgi:S1-C subfamily serine protease
LNVFFRTPTKLAILAILAGWLAITFSSAPVTAQDREPIMDLQRGGTEFFSEIVPSIVQIYNGGIYAEEMGSAGSGYVFDREGHAITNMHVADAAPVLEIAFYGDETSTREYAEGRWRAELIAQDPALDLAVIKIDAPADQFHPVRLGDSSVMEAGDTVATFGSPGGDPGWVDRSWIAIHDSWLEFYNLNLGIISEVMDFEEAFWTYNDVFASNYVQYFSRVGPRDYGTAVQYLFHTDSAINHGNSGGPCLNVYGEAVGTNTWGFPGENVGFSVPVNLLKRSVADILEYGRVRRPWCGIALHPSQVPSGELNTEWEIGAYPFQSLNMFDPTPDELRIYNVNPYSPAYEAGLRKDDVILRIDGQTYRDIFNVYSYLLSRDLGDEVVIEYERDGVQMPPAVVTIGEKQTRYYGTDIDVRAFGPFSVDITRYSADVTY